MFDIVSFIREKIFRREKLSPAVAGEELSEKQTTKLGYFLLYCMFGAILASAQWTLDIIKHIPTAPTPVPYCITQLADTLDPQNIGSSYYDSYQYGGYYGGDNCTQLTSTYPVFDFSNNYATLSGANTDVKRLSEELRNLESQNQNAQYNEQRIQQDYNTSLAEKMAQENAGIYDKAQIQNQLQQIRAQGQSSIAQIQSLKDRIEKIRLDHKSAVSELRTKIKKANDDYSSAYLMYKLYIAILSFIFAIIVFSVLYKMYVRQKLKNSPHTIIFSVATFAYGLVLLQISCLFIWDIIPHKILMLIQELLAAFTPLVYLLQFLWPLVIVAVF
jgi:3-methyladenine DNA glycosylase AlkC